MKVKVNSVIIAPLSLTTEKGFNYFTKDKEYKVVSIEEPYLFRVIDDLGEERSLLTRHCAHLEGTGKDWIIKS